MDFASSTARPRRPGHRSLSDGVRSTVAGQSLVGKIGSVVRAIRGGALPGEVRVVVHGLPHYLIAYSKDPVAHGVQVLVIHNRGSRQVDVEPWPQEHHPDVER
jgi:hypothetical protein